MKKIVFAAAALVMISASAHAATYSVDGVTVHVADGCRSSSCVSVDAPGYGYYHARRPVLRKAHKDEARVAAVKKDAATAPAAAPAGDVAPARTMDKAPDAAAPTAPLDAAPAK